ncbi:hypothetical protein TNCV_2682691 [Trichonephila clavipes]|nr:hypothetical protein TNCV_2682691 [Trichonephila clavipes]
MSAMLEITQGIFSQVWTVFQTTETAIDRLSTCHPLTKTTANYWYRQAVGVVSRVADLGPGDPTSRDAESY